MKPPKLFRQWADKAKRAASSNWLRQRGFNVITAETSIGSSGDPSNTNPAGVSGVFCQSGSREAWWPLTPQLDLASGQPGSEPLPGTYISFAPQDDQSLLMDKAQHSLVRDLISDIGEPVFALRYVPPPTPEDSVRASAQGDNSVLLPRLKAPWLYATTQARLNTLPGDVQLISGLAAIRGLLATSDLTHALKAPFVTGVLFSGDAVQVLILMVCSENGELGQMDYIPLAGLDPASAIRSYVQTVRLSASGEWTQDRTAIFGGHEVLRLGSALRAYPRESEVLGVPISKLWRVAAVASGASLVCTGTAVAALSYLNHSDSAQIQQQQQQAQAQQQSITQMLASDRLAAVLERKSVRTDEAIAKATAVWQDGAKVTITATPELLKLSAAHKVQSTEQSPDQTPQALARALSIPAPTGCQRLPPSITSQITALYLTYECQTPDPDLQRLGSVAR